MDPLTIISLISALVSAGGGLASLFGGNKGGSGQNGIKRVPNFNPQMMQGLDQLFNMSLGGLQGNQPSFGPIAQNAQRDWATQSIPLLAERFGGMGARRSGAFEGALSGATRQFNQDLRGQEQQFGQQNRNQLLQQLQLGLTPQFESIYKGRQPGFGENLAVAAAPSLIKHAPAFFESLGKLGGV